MLHSGVNIKPLELASVNQRGELHYNVGNEMLELRETLFCNKMSV